MNFLKSVSSFVESTAKQLQGEEDDDDIGDFEEGQFSKNELEKYVLDLRQKIRGQKDKLERFARIEHEVHAVQSAYAAVKVELSKAEAEKEEWKLKCEVMQHSDGGEGAPSGRVRDGVETQLVMAQLEAARSEIASLNTNDKLWREGIAQLQKELHEAREREHSAQRALKEVNEKKATETDSNASNESLRQAFDVKDAELRRLHADIDKLQKDLTQMVAINDSLRQELAERQTAALVRVDTAHERALAEREEELQRLRTESARDKQEMLSRISEMAEVGGLLRDQLASAEAEAVRLRALNYEAARHEEVLTHLQQKLKVVEEEKFTVIQKNAVLESQLTRLASVSPMGEPAEQQDKSTQEASDGDLDKLEAELEALEEKLRIKDEAEGAAMQLIEREREKAEELNGKVAKLTLDLRKTQEEYSAIAHAYHELRDTTASSLQEDCRQKTDLLAAARREIAEKEQEFALRCVRLEGEYREQMAHQQDMGGAQLKKCAAELAESRSALEDSRRQHELARGDISRMGLRVAELESQLREMTKKCQAVEESAHQEFQKESARIAEALVSLREENASLKEGAFTLEDENRVLRERLSDVEIQLVQSGQRAEELDKENESYEKSLSELQIQLSAMNEASSQRSVELAQSKEKLRSLEGATSEAATARAESAALAIQMEALHRELEKKTELAEELAGLRQTISACLEKERKAAEEVASLRGEASAAQQRAASLACALDEARRGPPPDAPAIRPAAKALALALYTRAGEYIGQARRAARRWTGEARAFWERVDAARRSDEITVNRGV